MLGPCAAQQNVPADDGRRAGQGSGLDAIRDGLVLHAPQAWHPLHQDGAGSGSGHPRAHGVEALGQIHNFRLLGGVLDAADAMGQGGGHHDVFRRAHAGRVQIDRTAVQGAAQFQISRPLGDFRAQGLHALDVQIDGPLADGAAAGQADARMADSSQQGAHDQHGSAHPPHGIVVGRHAWLLRAKDQPPVFALDGAAAGFQQFA